MSWFLKTVFFLLSPDLSQRYSFNCYIYAANASTFRELFMVGESQIFMFRGKSQGERCGRSRCWTCSVRSGGRGRRDRPSPCGSRGVLGVRGHPRASRSSCSQCCLSSSPWRHLAGEAESAGLLSCVCPEASPWDSAPAPGSEPRSAAGLGPGAGEGEPCEPS